MPAQQEFNGHDQLAYATAPATALATIKQQPADFKVDEELGFECTGSGEHLFLKIQKTNWSTTEVARELARRLRVRELDVGYSGMKDQRAETTQWFSVVLPESEESRLQDLQAENLQILTTVRNERKLRIGSHRANHFHLQLKNFEGDREDTDSRLASLSLQGVPNYFGKQRFGHGMSNLHQVQTLLLGAKDSALSRGKRKRRGMLYSAARAYLFNEILSRRIQQQTWAQYVDGDVLNLDGTGRCFVIAAGQWDAELQQRLKTLDIHCTGLLAGHVPAGEKYVTRGQAADIEDGVSAEYQSLCDGLVKHGLQAARRALRFRVQDLQWQWLENGSGTILELQFSLPRGAYATSLLRELCVASVAGN